MASNLPPGVREGDIPGNRPEDAWWDTFTDQLKVPAELFNTDPEATAASVNSFLETLNEMFGAGVLHGLGENVIRMLERDGDD